MEFESTTGHLKALAHVILPGVRKLRAERRAAQFPASIRPNNDFLDQQLETALVRLGLLRTEAIGARLEARHHRRYD